MSGNANSYLAVILPSALRDELDALSGDLQSALISEHNSVDFNRMEWSNLHMTFVFAGGILHALPSASLLAWHEGIERILKEETEESSQPPSLRLERLDLFPPEKKNLIVARFIASDALHTIHRKIINLASEIECPEIELLRRISPLNPLQWEPHITLGKIRAPKSTVAEVGERALRSVTEKIKESKLAKDEIIVPGVHMGGKRPCQAWIDWESLPGLDETRVN